MMNGQPCWEVSVVTPVCLEQPTTFRNLGKCCYRRDSTGESVTISRRRSGSLRRNTMNRAGEASDGTNPRRVSGTARHLVMHRLRLLVIRASPEHVFGWTPNSTWYTYFCQIGCFPTAVINLFRKISVPAFRMSFMKQCSTIARQKKAGSEAIKSP